MKKYLIVGAVLVGLVAPFPATALAAHHREPAEVAVRHARNAIGTRYTWGGASKRRGFDCSGLTMWAWHKAGKRLPHSSALQHQRTQHVPRRRLERGDLLFFYHPIHHVAIYIGHGRMIEAPHEGSHVRRTHVYWGAFVGGGRP